MNKDDMRLCRVNGKLGYFHKWCTTDMASYAIVEFKEGMDIVDVKSIQFCDEIHAGLASMHKEMEEAPSQEKDKIRKILIQANAVSCNALGFECYPVGNNLKSSVIPSGYHVEVDFNKMAQALYNAGYRKAE